MDGWRSSSSFVQREKSQIYESSNVHKIVPDKNIINVVEEYSLLEKKSGNNIWVQKVWEKIKEKHCCVITQRVCGIAGFEESVESHWIMFQNILQTSFSWLQFLKVISFSLESESHIVIIQEPSISLSKELLGVFCCRSLIVLLINK